jgi:probable HAF family extracellular repeat protein
MKTRTSKLRMNFAVLMVIVGVSSLSTAQQYTVTDLGTLGGKLSSAAAINRSGQVVGNSEVAGYPNIHAFLWSADGGMRDLGFLNEADNTAYAYGINDAGEVVGVSYGNNGLWGAFLWTQSEGMMDIGSLGGGSTNAYAINNVEQVVGSSGLSDGLTAHAFLWTRSGGMKDLGSFGGNSFAYAINNSGEVVGDSFLADGVTDHAFVWTEATGMQDIGTLGGSFSYAAAINDFGRVVGSSTAQDASYDGFLWDSAGGMRALASVPNTGVSPTGINTSGFIVGILFPARGLDRGIVWAKPQQIQNLNGLITPKNPLVTWVGGVNAHGQIAGNGDNGHALLLTPTKQPSSQRSKP